MVYDVYRRCCGASLSDEFREVVMDKSWNAFLLYVAFCISAASFGLGFIVGLAW